jgi:hypothetical protein
MLHERLREMHVPSELIVVTGRGHGDSLITDPQGAPWKRTVEFLREHLGLLAPSATQGQGGINGR